MPSIFIPLYLHYYKKSSCIRYAIWIPTLNSIPMENLLRMCSYSSLQMYLLVKAKIASFVVCTTFVQIRHRIRWNTAYSGYFMLYIFLVYLLIYLLITKALINRSITSCDGFFFVQELNCAYYSCKYKNTKPAQNIMLAKQITVIKKFHVDYSWTSIPQLQTIQYLQPLTNESRHNIRGLPQFVGISIQMKRKPGTKADMREPEFTAADYFIRRLSVWTFLFDQPNSIV